MIFHLGTNEASCEQRSPSYGCHENDLTINELMVTYQTRYNLLVIGGVEEDPGPDLAKAQRGKY